MVIVYLTNRKMSTHYLTFSKILFFVQIWGGDIVKTDKIRELAKQNDLPLAFLCRRLGVAKVYFNDIDKSGRDIPEDKLKIIADLLNTTPEYLKGETETKEKGSATENGDRSLTKEEWDVISAYRAASEEIKDAVKRIVKP